MYYGVWQVADDESRVLVIRAVGWILRTPSQGGPAAQNVGPKSQGGVLNAVGTGGALKC